MTSPRHPHAIIIGKNPNRVKVTFNGTVIADTSQALVLREGSLPPVNYLIREDVKMSYLRLTDHAKHYPERHVQAALNCATPCCEPLRRAARSALGIPQSPPGRVAGGGGMWPGGRETTKAFIFPIPGLGSCWKGEWLITHLNVEGRLDHGFDNRSHE